jgi:retinoid hydroxylase
MKAKLPPGRRGLPFIGYTHTFSKDPFPLLMSAYQKYGEIFYFYTAGRPNVYMIGSKATKFTLQDHPDWFSAREGNLIVAQKLFGNSILYMDGEEHKALRSAMMPLFRTNVLEHYTDIMIEVITWELKGWVLENEIDVYQKAKRIILEIVVRTFLDISLTDYNAYLQKYVDLLSAGLYADNTYNLPWTRFGKAREARDRLYKIFDPLVELRRKHPSNDLISLLLSANELSTIVNTNRDIIDQINTFLFAGYDTSTSTIAWAVWYLDQHPNVTSKVKEEFERVLGAGKITYVATKQLKYLDWVIEEVIRLRPPVYFIPRMTTQDVVYEGYTIPKGWLVNVVPLISHQLPQIFSQPGSFAPDRFLPPFEEHKRAPLSLIGFGAGPKTCMGISFAKLQIKLFLITLLKLYKFKAKEGQELAFNWIASLHPDKGPIISLESNDVGT